MRTRALFPAPPLTSLFTALLALAPVHAGDPGGWYPFTPTNALAQDGAISLRME